MGEDKRKRVAHDAGRVAGGLGLARDVSTTLIVGVCSSLRTQLNVGG